MLLIQEDIEEPLTLNASNTYPYLSEFDSWDNKSNVNRNADTHGLY
jgi:hypothetical protein